jgi:hypothetical protein
MITVRYAPYYSKISTNDGGFYRIPVRNETDVPSGEVFCSPRPRFMMMMMMMIHSTQSHIVDWLKLSVGTTTK